MRSLGGQARWLAERQAGELAAQHTGHAAVAVVVVGRRRRRRVHHAAMAASGQLGGDWQLTSAREERNSPASTTCMHSTTGRGGRGGSGEGGGGDSTGDGGGEGEGSGTGSGAGAGASAMEKSPPSKNSAPGTSTCAYIQASMHGGMGGCRYAEQACP